jgi:multiple antibiotic resistance protein
MEQHLQAIATILSLVNPMICAAMFARIEAGQPQAARMADATKAAFAVLVILVVAALVGEKLLELFGVSLDAFSVAGGGVLSSIGLTMLSANSVPAQEAPKDSADLKPSMTPLIMFAASPGTITGVITLAVTHSKGMLPVTALVAIAVATIALWIVMIVVARGKSHSSGGFVRDTVTRFMGLIVIAMGVQFALTGIRGFFPPTLNERGSGSHALAER